MRPLYTDPINGSIVSFSGNDTFVHQDWVYGWERIPMNKSEDSSSYTGFCYTSHGSFFDGCF